MCETPHEQITTGIKHPDVKYQGVSYPGVKYHGLTLPSVEFS